MKNPATMLAAALSFAVLSLWIEERWAWSLFQLGIFLIAGWRAVGSKRVNVSIALAILAAAAAWPLVQLAAGASISRGLTWDAALNWFTFLVVFAVAGDLFAEAAALRTFLRFAPVFGMLVATVAILQKYSSRGKIFWIFSSGFDDGVLGPFVNRNQFAAWLELLFPVALYQAATARRARLLYGVAAAIMFGAVLASESRAGFALACGEVLAVGAVLAAGATSRKRLVAGAIQFAVLVLVASGAAGWRGLEHRLETTGPEALRLDAAQASMQMVRERPWMGSGLGTWSIVYPRFAGFDAGVFVNQAHNDWLQWAAEGGVPFVILMAIFAALLWKPAFQSIYGLGTLAFLLHAFVDYPMQQRPGLAAWFFAMAGATTAWPRGVGRNG